MQYIFKLNFHEHYYAFYDWLNSDDIREFNDAQVVKVDSDVLEDLINYNVRIKEVIDDKVYIYSDTFSFVAILFKDNISYKVSSIMLGDEYKLKKILNELKYSKVMYDKISRREETKELRYMDKIKKALYEEVSHLSENDADKLKYLYYEWFDSNGSNIKLLKKKMLNKLKEPITKKEKYIYDLILSSKK